MPRKYVSRGLRGKWSEEQLKLAVSDVLNNSVSVKHSAEIHGIPRLTLRRHVKRASQGFAVSKKLGRSSVLSAEQETELVDLILSMVNRLFGLTKRDVRGLVFKYCEANNIKHTFNRKRGLAGRDWFEGFLRRHKDLALRTPEATSIQRAIGFNQQKVRIFFDKLQDILFGENNVRKIPSANIYNVDESGFSICHRPSGKVVAKKGSKAVGAMTSAEKGRTITAVCCVSATGHYIPPMLIFPRARMKPGLLDDAPVGAIGAANPSGWITEDLFTKWFDHFVAEVQPASRHEPTLLIMDGHSAHTRNIAVIAKARDQNVILLSLPSHSTHRMQPLDVSFFKSVNTFYDAEVQTWMRQHGRALSEWQVSKLFTAAYNKAATVQNAVSGYEKCGINPFCPGVFTEEDFIPSLLTDRDEPQNDTGRCMSSTISHAATRNIVSYGVWIPREGLRQILGAGWFCPIVKYRLLAPWRL